MTVGSGDGAYWPSRAISARHVKPDQAIAIVHVGREPLEYIESKKAGYFKSRVLVDCRGIELQNMRLIVERNIRKLKIKVVAVDMHRPPSDSRHRIRKIHSCRGDEMSRHGVHR